jgi:hypothetical protein
MMPQRPCAWPNSSAPTSDVIGLVVLDLSKNAYVRHTPRGRRCTAAHMTRFNDQVSTRTFQVRFSEPLRLQRGHGYSVMKSIS